MRTVASTGSAAAALAVCATTATATMTASVSGIHNATAVSAATCPWPLHFHTTVLGHFGTYLVEESTSLGTTKVGATTSTVIRPKLRALLITLA